MYLQWISVISSTHLTYFVSLNNSLIGSDFYHSGLDVTPPHFDKLEINVPGLHNLPDECDIISLLWCLRSIILSLISSLLGLPLWRGACLP